MKKVLFLALIASSFASNAIAQQDPVRAAQERACGRDASRFCKPLIDQGDLAVLGCLQQNRSKLTQACQKVLRDNGV